MLGLLLLGAWCSVLDVKLLHTCRDKTGTDVGGESGTPLTTGTACAWQASGWHLPQAPIDCRESLYVCVYPASQGAGCNACGMRVAAGNPLCFPEGQLGPPEVVGSCRQLGAGSRPAATATLAHLQPWAPTSMRAMAFQVRPGLLVTTYATCCGMIVMTTLARTDMLLIYDLWRSWTGARHAGHSAPRHAQPACLPTLESQRHGPSQHCRALQGTQ